MVAHLVRLKLTLLRNGLRRSPWQLVGLAFGALYALGIIGALVMALVFLRNQPTELAATAVVLGGAVAIIGWAIIPVMISGTDMTLDPARFTTFAIPLKKMLPGLALGGLIGIPGIATVLVSLATVATWWHGVLPAVAALVGALLGVLTCVVVSKVTTTATASLASSRRFKDVSAIAFMVPLVLLGPIIAGVTRGIVESSAFLPELARTLAWTPLGAPWGLAADVTAGNYGQAALKLLIAAATIGVLSWLWKTLMQQALVTPPYSGSSKRKGSKLGLLGLFPATPTGAVTARALTYWLRDPRYSGSLVVIPLLPVVLVFSGAQSGEFGALAILAPLCAFILAWSISADVSYDNTAFALHLATGVSGRADRLGRALACLLFSLPTVLIFAFGYAVLADSWAMLPGLLGLSLGILFSGLGLASLVSARYTTPVPLPGDSPFKKPPGNMGQTLLVQFGGMAVLFVLVLPEVGLLIAELVTGNSALGWLNLILGPVLGLVLFVVGVRIGGKWLDARGPELLAQVGVNK